MSNAIDDDEGFSSRQLSNKKSSPLSGLKASRGEDYSYVPKGKGFKGATTKELYDYALEESQNVTSSIEESVMLSREIKSVAQGTLVELDRQGEKIQQIQANIFSIDQVLEKGLKIINGLGGCFQSVVRIVFRNKSDDQDEDNQSHVSAPPSKKTKELDGSVLDKLQRVYVKEGTPTEISLTDDSTNPEMLKLMKEREVQDEMLDEVSENMSALKSMVVSMGQSIDSQTAAISSLSTDFDKVKQKTVDLNKKGNALL